MPIRLLWTFIPFFIIIVSALSYHYTKVSFLKAKIDTCESIQKKAVKAYEVEVKQVNKIDHMLDNVVKDYTNNTSKKVVNENVSSTVGKHIITFN